MPGNMPMMLCIPPIFCICSSWLRRSFMLNRPLEKRFAMRSACSASKRLSGLFDQRHDVAHAEDAAGDTIGLEGLQRVHLFAKADKADRLAGDGAHRKRSAAASVAVHPGQDDAR